MQQKQELLFTIAFFMRDPCSVGPQCLALKNEIA
jgi:hypothetical protein